MSDGADWQREAWEAARAHARRLGGPEAESHADADERLARWHTEAQAAAQAEPDAEPDWDAQADALSLPEDFRAQISDAMEAHRAERDAEIADLDAWFSGPDAQAGGEPEA